MHLSAACTAVLVFSLAACSGSSGGGREDQRFTFWNVLR